MWIYEISVAKDRENRAAMKQDENLTFVFSVFETLLSSGQRKEKELPQQAEEMANKFWGVSNPVERILDQSNH